MISNAQTVDEYLASLPPDRREAIEAVRRVILANLDQGLEEGMQYGAIGYFVPHSRYPAGYHCDPKQPLPFAGLASQKNHMAIYLSCMYFRPGSETAFRQAWAKTGKKLDMGKACIRFKKLDDLPLELIGQTIARATLQDHIALYEAAIHRSPAQRESRASAAKKTAKKTATPAAKKGAAKKPAGKVAKKAVKKASAGGTAKKAVAKSGGKRPRTRI